MVVVYGAGAAARAYVKRHELSNYVVATTDGEGEVFGVPAIRFDTIDMVNIERIVVASSFAGQIVQYLRAFNIDMAIVQVYYPESDRLASLKDSLQADNSRVLYAIYDLDGNPATYDVTVFVVRAELYARENGYSDIHFVIVPPIFKSGRPGDSGFYRNKASSFHWKVMNIVVPVMSCSACYSGVSLLTNRRDVSHYESKSPDIFPQGYSSQSPRDEHLPALISEAELKLLKSHAVFHIPEFARDIVNKLNPKGEEKTLVTVTLREYEHQIERNNNLPEWLKFLSSLDDTKYRVIVIRDTEKITAERPDGWEKFTFFDGASLSLPLRIAIYSAGGIHLFCNNGPAYLASFLPDCHYLIFNMAAGGYACNSPEFFKKRFLMNVGEEQYFWALNSCQRLVWEPDTFETLKNNFHKMERDLINEQF